jgi:hypothetical protein
MKNTEERELVLEVVKDGFRRLIFRQNIGNGSTLFLEESDLIDFSRPITENGDFNVFFTKRAFWKSFTEFTSNEGLLKKQVWHEQTNEWLNLKPVFIHADIRPLIQESLADATRNLSGDDTEQIEGLRSWLRKLSEPTTELNTIVNSAKKYRHAV